MIKYLSMNEVFDLNKYFLKTLDKKVHSFYVKKEIPLGELYFVNDAYVLKKYEEQEINELSLERLNSVHEIIVNEKISEKVLFIDYINKIKVTKLVHGDLSYEEEPSLPQVRNIAKLLKKLHHHVSENDIAMDLVSLFYKFKEESENLLPKIYENKIVREFNNIKDKTPIGLCHNLLNKDNVIYRFDSAFLMNFELSNINYNYFDLASYIFENNLSLEIKKEFLKTYFGSTFNSLKERRVDVFIEFYKGFYYYFWQYLYKLTNKDFYLLLSDRYKKD